MIPHLRVWLAIWKKHFTRGLFYTNTHTHTNTNTHTHTHTHTHAHTHYNFQYTIIIFFRHFRIVPLNKNFSFHRLTKPSKLLPAVLTKPCFAHNFLGSTLVLYIVFIIDFFPWIHIERFQSTEARQFCLRLRVIGRSVQIIISRALDAVFYMR